ncbi:31-O-demethyl-FK506 methyltransferase FkbM [Legionella massiliensis]|uniref:31-O-demethyl-FK506 methyltransferase FkbM n=1 Tax=Legionella massiliensis TaxID=1034943 RepID=A0A078L0S4_9GAMM|nr:FkbM family methyltransferase [Legionella massiliensis]CDZ78847.1 31-O-demethyl-FK506 methyltransferase FkbM [Legionella massiliensis]CEE14585.1 31-O-demethyl-FK506 methyltransferase FkbM [Legionella massiliensis]
MPDPILNKEFSIGNLYFINEYETRELIYEIFYQNAYLLSNHSFNPGSTIIDVGANIGLFSLFALKQCEYDALIYSFEPIPSTFECLKKNLAPFKNKTRIYNLGIGDVVEDCSVEFTLFGDDFSTATFKPEDKMVSNYNPLLDYDVLLEISQFRDKFLYYQLKFLPFMRNYLIKRNFKNQTSEKKVQCQLTSLGRFIENNGINHIDFIKIDVEGAEFDVVKSIKTAQFPMIQQLCIEVNNIDNRLELISSYLQEQGYLIQTNRSEVYEKLGFNQYMIYAKRA